MIRPIKIDQAGIEMMMTAEQAISWAEKRFERTGLWPTRRFRVEGSRAGTSRLVTKSRAAALRDKYGGSVVELIPARERTKRVSKNTDRAHGLAACPRCGAAPDVACRDKKGERKPHAQRPRAES